MSSADATEAREAFVSGRRDGCLQGFAVLPSVGKPQPAATVLSDKRCGKLGRVVGSAGQDFIPPCGKVARCSGDPRGSERKLK